VLGFLFLVHFATGCKDLNGKWIGLRFLNLTHTPPDTQTTAGVASTFVTGFAPIIRKQGGLIEYSGSLPSDAQTVFFFNSFTSNGGIQKASTDAQNFISSSSLAGTVQLGVPAMSGQVLFFYNNDFCVPNHLANQLDIRVWRLNTNNSYTQATVVATFQNELAPSLVKLPGFLEYGGVALNSDKTLVLFWNVFTNGTTSTAATALVIAFVSGGALNSVLTPYLFSSGVVAFDFYNEQGSGGISGVAIALIVFILLSILFAIILIFLCTRAETTRM